MAGFITIKEVEGKPEIVGYEDYTTGEYTVLRTQEDALAFFDKAGGAAGSSSLDFPEEYGLTAEYVNEVLPS